MKDRVQLIDNLRGISIVVMILTHTNAFFLQDKLAFVLWNFSQFSVPVFIFCSMYLFIKKYLNTQINYFSYFKRRFVRLLVPYYIFLFFFLISLLVFNPKIVTIDYVWKSVLLVGGVDINWLVLLFVYITIILPFFIWSIKKSKILFWLFFIVSLSSSVWLLFSSFLISYKWIMWLPWSVMFYFIYVYIKFEENKKALFWLFVISCSLFIISYGIQNILHHDLVFRNNKYPPNIFYISFGTSVILGFSLLRKYIFNNSIFIRILHFFSKYSYSIYFIHYTILTILVMFMKQLQFNWLTLFFVVLISTVCLQWLFNKKTHNNS